MATVMVDGNIRTAPSAGGLAGLAMALSSISVVTNSLTLRAYRPGRRNWLSMAAPIAMTVVFTSLFVVFAQISSQME